MSEEANRTAALLFFENVFRRREPARLAETVAPHCVVWLAGYPEPFRGLPALQSWAESYLSAWKSELTIDDVIADGDNVVVRFTIRGTHVGEYAGFPATGSEVTFTALEWFRFEGGKAVECWTRFDTADVFQQLGILPKGRPPRALSWLLSLLSRRKRRR